MIKIIAWHFGLGVLLNVIAIILTAIVYSLLSLLFASFTGFVLPAIIVHIAVAFICGGGGIFAIVRLFEIKTHLSRLPQYPDGIYEKLWYQPIKCNRPIKFVKLQMGLILFSLIGVLFTFLAKLQYSKVADTVYETGNALGGWLLAVMASMSAMIWFIYWFYFMVHYCCATCGCGRVMTREERSTENYNSATSTQTKTKDTYGVIGDIYWDNRKVGEVSGKTGSYTQQRAVKIRSWTSNCRCIYCAKAKKVSHSESDIGEWKN